MQVFLQYSVFSGLCAKCTKWQGRFSTSFRDLTLDISKVRDYNGHIKNEGGARDEAFCHGSDESVEPYRCCCVRTGVLLCLQSIRNPQHLPGRCHSGCVHFSLPDYEKASRTIGASMEKLQVDYLDMVLLHWSFANYYAAWRVLERFYLEGTIRAIGVSNFDSGRLIDLRQHRVPSRFMRKIICRLRLNEVSRQ